MANLFVCFRVEAFGHLGGACIAFDIDKNDVTKRDNTAKRKGPRRWAG